MDGMMYAVLAVCGVLATGTGLWMLRRPGVDEAHSVEGYQQALSTLEGIRTRSSTVRVIGQPPVQEPGSPSGARGPGPDAGDGGSPGGPGPVAGATPPRTPAASTPAASIPAARTPAASIRAARTPAGSDAARPVFDDAGPGAPPGGHNLGIERRRQDRSISVMNRPSRRLGGPIVAAVVVIALVGVLLAIGARPRPRSHAAGGAGTTGSTTLPAHSPTTAHPAASGTAATHPTSPRSTPTTPTTTSTLPTQFVAVGSTSSTATYHPGAVSYTLTVTATSGSCWVEIRGTGAGPALLAQTLAPGEQQSVPAQGNVTVLLGAPGSAQVTLDGVPVVVPDGLRAPVTLMFAPPAQPAPVTSTTTAASG